MPFDCCDSSPSRSRWLPCPDGGANPVEPLAGWRRQPRGQAGLSAAASSSTRCVTVLSLGGSAREFSERDEYALFAVARACLSDLASAAQTVNLPSGIPQSLPSGRGR